jgi:hypothetical protein
VSTPPPVSPRKGPRRRVGRDVGVVLCALLPHPSLWWAGIAALVRFSRRGWWRRPPFLPVPGESYWDFRLVTAFGGQGNEVSLERHDVVAFLQWCRRTRPRRG